MGARARARAVLRTETEGSNSHSSSSSSHRHNRNRSSHHQLSSHHPRSSKRKRLEMITGSSSSIQVETKKGLEEDLSEIGWKMTGNGMGTVMTIERVVIVKGAGRVEGRPEAGRRLARLPGQQHGPVLPPTFLVADELM